MRTNCITIYLSVTLTLQISWMPMTRSDDWSQSCASNCTCKWTNGKKSAICSSLQLTTIPTTLSTELQVLVLNDNHIPYLNREEFINLGLMNLQRIYLKKSEVHYLHKEAFKDLKILVEIDLSDNRIEMLDKGTFMGNDRLRILYLNGNPLKRLVAYQFPILPHLRTLDLHDCLISYIDPMALANLNLLEFLYLKNNLLENLSEYVFHHMTNLKTLVLDDNPWQCNCKLRKFRTWYVESNLNSVTLICKGPLTYKDKAWDQVEEKLFGCAPKVEIFNNEDVQNIEIGSNTSFSCLVYGDPLPTVSWELNGKILDNDNVMFEIEHIASDKLWSNLTIFNMTSLDAGTYVCTAINIVGVGAQNISIYLTEIVQHVLIKTPETFWYFGLIMGTFGTIFLLILLSFVVCVCKRTSSQRRLQRKPGVKPSVSFNDQEKKLLDLSITTTTNDRGDSCVIDSNHGGTSLNKTDSLLGGFEPIEIHSVENHRNSLHGHHGLLMASTHHHHHHHHHQMPHSTGNNVLSNRQQQQQQQLMAIADGSCSIVGIPKTSLLSGNTSGAVHANPISEEFPLNVGVFPPPPEFCSNMITNPAYGNIFISVSVTQDMLDSADVNTYPDLLNIAKRGTERERDNAMAGQLKSSANKTVESALQLATKFGGGVGGGRSGSGDGATLIATGGVNKLNVTSFATLPRNSQRRGILKKDTSLQSNQLPGGALNQTNLYPHEEIVSYHNLDTTYSLGYQQQRQQNARTTISGGTFHELTPTPPQLPSAAKKVSSSMSTCHHHAAPSSSTFVQCPICLSSADGDNSSTTNSSGCSTPPIDLTALRSLCKSAAKQSPLTLTAASTTTAKATATATATATISATEATVSSSYLKYDNMGRRITLSGNSVLSLPDEERLENETHFNLGRSITKTTTVPAYKLNSNSNSNSNNNNSLHSTSNGKQPQDCKMAPATTSATPNPSPSPNPTQTATPTPTPTTITITTTTASATIATTSGITATSQTSISNINSCHKNGINAAGTNATTIIHPKQTRTMMNNQHHNKKIADTNNEFISL